MSESEKQIEVARVSRRTVLKGLAAFGGAALWGQGPVTRPGWWISRAPLQNSVLSMWSGAVTSGTATISARLSADSAQVRFVASPFADMRSPVYSPYKVANLALNNRVVKATLTGLFPNVRYYYAVEYDGQADMSRIGRFKTFPTGAASFTVAFASCAVTGSSAPVFDLIRSLRPLLFLHTGDFHYENIDVNDRDLFRRAYDRVLAAPAQAALYGDIPVNYIWDDHDYGANNSDRTSPSREAARLTYREYVPHYGLPAGTGNQAIYHAFTIGRVRFIVTDNRSERSPYTDPDTSQKTMLGATQKAWFKQTLLAANGNYSLIVWVNSLPWIGLDGDDGWYLYATERRELANFIKNRGIRNLVMLSGDAHMLAIDDGTNSDYADGGGAGFPVMHAAALDSTPSVKGGPYSHGAFPGTGQFGLMTVTDSDGDVIHVSWQGKKDTGETVVSYSFTWPMPPRPGLFMPIIRQA
ncbi:MAG: alkaline phosphatase D family protein [Anaerolineales bacterium]|nr:alkaline phosphatase D family protein [Anaerolineales bacterium]